MTTRILLAFALALPLVSPSAEPLKRQVNLLDVIKSGKVTHHVNPAMSLHDPPEKIWTFTPDGQLKISGMGFGYVRTNDDYRDYHLVLEYKFTGPTMGTREGKARDNGILVHSHGPDGAYSNTWMASIEAQIIEGGTGDILVLSPKLPDGTELITSVTSEFAFDRDKEKIWKKGEPRQVVTKGRINWEKRDVDWKDEAGFRGRDDVQSRVNEWTRLEVIAKSDTLQYFVNGVLVNEAFDCKPSAGKICLQTEGAEMLVKRYELYPLGQFTEKWNPVSASGGTDIPVKASRETAWSPEDERKAIELDGPYELQLVAAEPLVRDPVEMTWDAQGRCFVADMIDYPLGAGPGKPPLSRIQQLIDDDKDGRYDRAITFADKMDHVQGLLPFKDGLIATTRTQILFVRDTNGDGIADERKPLIAGFNPNHSQLQVSAPRWGLDNCVYFNNGLDTKEIYAVADGGADKGARTLLSASENEKRTGVSALPSLNAARSNFRWDPATGKIEPTTGFGQFGGCFDDWGRHFSCSNRSPVMFAVMPYEAVIRNPNAGITQGWEDIAPSGADTRVYPLQLTHTTADAHAGTNTAACGLGVYRGDLMPELRGNIFVPDPTGQLITRYTVAPNGASLKATRVGDHTEFFRSRDEWCRPVNVTTGPDGALYICDIYRRYIDHARFFPEEFAKTHDMRAGENEGRIWRVVPKAASGTGSLPVGVAGSLPAKGAAGATGKLPVSPTGWQPVPLRKIEPAPQKVEELVAWLGHPNAWQRETAQRLLVESPSIELSKTARAIMMSGTDMPQRLHCMWLFFGLSNSRSQWLQPLIANKTVSLEDAMPLTESYQGLVRSLWSNLSAEAKLLAENALIAEWRQQKTVVSTMAIWDPEVSKMLPHPDARLQFASLLWFSDENYGQGLVDSELYIGKPAKLRGEVVARFEDDAWLYRAACSASARSSGRTLMAYVSTKRLVGHVPAQSSLDFIRSLASCSAADANEEDFRATVSILNQDKGKLLWWKPALLQGLAEGLPKSGGKLGVKSLAELTSKPPEAFKDAAAEIAALLAQVDKVMTDATAPMEQRLACIPLLAQRSWDKAEPVMRTLLADGQPQEISNAALALLKKFAADKTAPLLYELLPKLGPNARLDVVKMLTGNGKTVKDFFERIDRGEVPKAFVDAETRWRYLRPNQPLHDLAVKIFGSPSTDRAAVMASYADAAKLKGDATKGHQIFSTICIACHRLKGEGVDVAPDITDVRIKEKEALLSDILDPNRMVEARWMAYQIDTKDGRTVSGIVSAETSNEVTVKTAGGVAEAIPRGNIAKMKCLDASLMPVGLEAGITKEQMADLLAFLKGE